MAEVQNSGSVLIPLIEAFDHERLEAAWDAHAPATRPEFARLMDAFVAQYESELDRVADEETAHSIWERAFQTFRVLAGHMGSGFWNPAPRADEAWYLRVVLREDLLLDRPEDALLLERLLLFLGLTPRRRGPMGAQLEDPETPEMVFWMECLEACESVIGYCKVHLFLTLLHFGFSPTAFCEFVPVEGATLLHPIHRVVDSGVSRILEEDAPPVSTEKAIAFLELMLCNGMQTRGPAAAFLDSPEGLSEICADNLVSVKFHAWLRSRGLAALSDEDFRRLRRGKLQEYLEANPGLEIAWEEGDHA